MRNQSWYSWIGLFANYCFMDRCHLWANLKLMGGASISKFTRWGGRKYLLYCIIVIFLSYDIFIFFTSIRSIIDLNGIFIFIQFFKTKFNPSLNIVSRHYITVTLTIMFVPKFELQLSFPSKTSVITLTTFTLCPSNPSGKTNYIGYHFHKTNEIKLIIKRTQLSTVFVRQMSTPMTKFCRSVQQ